MSKGNWSRQVERNARHAGLEMLFVMRMTRSHALEKDWDGLDMNKSQLTC
jgi:hypothetical protein